MTWQPIEAAPKDGDEYLLWSPTEGGHFVAYWHKGRGEWLWTMHSLDGDEALKRPTHWKPLDQPPE